MNRIKRFGKGQAMFYSPQWLQLTEPHHIRRRESHHAGAEPGYGEKPIKIKMKRIKITKYIEFLNREATNVDFEKSKAEVKSQGIMIVVGLIGAVLLIMGVGFI